MPYIESAILSAFIIGIISAASLPLGAITSFFWQPGRKTIAALMAFGAGALLAALTIDLVGSALEHGHFNALAIGSIIGGLLFIGLDTLVNNFGGYRRKFSTSMHHRNMQNLARLKRIFSKLGRTELFVDLDDENIEILSNSIETRFYAKESTIFERGDPSDELYIIIEGEVLQRNPRGHEQVDIPLFSGDAFGRAALFTGSPHAMHAFAKTDCWLSVIPKEALESLLLESTKYRESVLAWLKSEEIESYLKVKQKVDDSRVQSWLEEVEESFKEECILPDILPIVRNEEEFLEFAKKIGRIPWLDELDEEEADALSDFVVYKKFKNGEYLFKQGESANYLYLIHSGEVMLSDEGDSSEQHKIDKGNGVGGRAFACGFRHTLSAKASKKTHVWALKRTDLGKLFEAHPNFILRFIYYIQERSLSDYLEQRHKISATKVESWVERAVNDAKNEKTPTTLIERGVESSKQSGAALAIWLGILLDGIPESLVIGANMIHNSISLSLVAGLFLSNYPEALSSSRGMSDDGFSRSKIVIMWTSIMLFTGVGAALGNLFMQSAEPHWFAFLEGLAAGAMLTMIAQTMLPEAYHKGGSVTGMATLMGFLSTISLKTI